MLPQLNENNAVDIVEYVDDVYGSTDHQAVSPILLQPSTSTFSTSTSTFSTSTSTFSTSTKTYSTLTSTLNGVSAASTTSSFTLKPIRIKLVPSRPYKCHLCTKSFRQNVNLEVHLRMSHCKRGAKFPCTDCNETFSYKDGVIRHRRVVHGDANSEDVYQCEDCLRRFSTKDFLRRHRTIHGEVNSSDNVLLKCPDCLKTFAKRRYLRYHQQLKHSIDRKYKCEHCPKSFTLPKDLKTHSVAHSSERPYICSFCPMAFKRKRELSRHSMRAHQK